jgi:hypothetical protein
MYMQECSNYVHFHILVHSRCLGNILECDLLNASQSYHSCLSFFYMKKLEDDASIPCTSNSVATMFISISWFTPGVLEIFWSVIC